MNTALTIATINVAISLSLCALCAQVADTTALRFGLSASYMIHQHYANFSTIPGIPSCCQQQYGGTSAQGWSIGALGEYPIVKLDNALTISATGRALYFHNVGANLTALERVRIAGGTATIRHELETSLSAFMFEPTVTARYLRRLTASLGIQVGTFVQSAYQYRERIIEPDDITYTNGQRTFNGSTGILPGVSPLQIALVGGAALELQVNQAGTILPSLEAFYALPLRSVIPDIDWRIASLRLGFSLKFSPYRTTDLTPAELEQRFQDSLRQAQAIAQQALAEAQEARKKELKARITAIRPIANSQSQPSDTISYTIAATGNRDVRPTAAFAIRLKRIPTTQRIALLPMIFFAENSSIIPSRYKVLTSSSDASRFSPEALNTSSAASSLSSEKLIATVYYQIINIIGYRLRNAAKSMLTITGTALDYEQQPQRLAEARATAVASYLYNVWRIPREQIIISHKVLSAPHHIPITRHDELRSAQLSANSEGLLEDVILNIERRFTVPERLQLDLEIVAGQGLKQWDLEIFQFTQREALTIHAAQGQAPAPQTYTWDIRTHPPVSADELSMRLTIDDITNNRFEAPLVTLKVVEEPPHIREERSILLHNTPNDTLRKIALIIQQSQQYVDIDRPHVYYTHRDGLLQRLINFQDISSSTTISQKRIFDDATPEGRMYAMGLVVEYALPK
ncbi:MAG: hypothetical protein NZ661_00050 [Candidatus Kapabacteria bacterium]|nr:hypothetical protein [Candidatus Kapabacteria bacterium]